MASSLPERVPLICSPTPLHRLDRISEATGLDFWIKRDDLTGFAMGGNKGRKLEFIMAEALQQRAEVVVTCGAVQSNFIRQLGAACSRFGLQCAAAVMDCPFDGPAGHPETPSPAAGGNELLDHILAVDLRHFPDDIWEVLYERFDELADEYSKTKKVYKVASGGATVLGAYAFRAAAQEIAAQTESFDNVVLGTGSGSTQAGLLHGLPAGTRVIGVASDPEPDLVYEVERLCQELDALLGIEPRDRLNRIELHVEYVGPGYGIPSEQGNKAIKLLAHSEGIFLDPIYSGKAFSGLLDMASKKEITGRTLFWHTGGMPALFARPR